MSNLRLHCKDLESIIFPFLIEKFVPDMRNSYCYSLNESSFGMSSVVICFVFVLFKFLVLLIRALTNEGMGVSISKLSYRREQHARKDVWNR